MHHTVLLLLIIYTEARMFCEKSKIPLEQGVWRYDLQHMDAAIVDNRPVSINEGQIYVYENYFPGYTIRYVNVDNLAMKSCGASATIKNGGVGSSSVFIVLHAESNQEIRSVIDIWGIKNYEPKHKVDVDPNIKNMKSLYLFKGLRVVHHNKGY
ncbi:uncharacterized protein LOC113518619 [Galleria mellonella]|uniref:Uncharacterized protein LOC113518619 n=1 Tax=Galleria mellonella TaxID=7137 RepID=A0ABM3MIY4_GALME|nr:uncharacterized protein LOC113518619 [Galleria mellonella]